MCALNPTFNHEKFTFSASLNAVEITRNTWELFLKNQNLVNEAIEAWRLVFTECLVNAIVHGAKENEKNTIEISWWRDNASIYLEIIDPGTGPDLKKIENAQLPEDPLDDHGRGLFIIKQFCDDWQHWISTTGYRQVLKKTYPDLKPPDTFDPVLEQALNEISLCYESLSAFYRLGEALMNNQGLNTFLNEAINDLKNLIKADAIGLNLNPSTLEPALYESLKNSPIIFHTTPNNETLFQKLTLEDPEWIWDNPNDIHQATDLKNYASGWMRQLSMKGKILGHSFAARSSSNNYFNAAEINTLRTFCDLFSIAIAQANNAIARDNEQQALRELEIASELQEKLFPIPDLPKNPYESLFIKRQSARQVGGDYVDAVIAPNGDLILVMVDVMGKGVSAAFLAATIRTALRINIHLEKSLPDLIQTLNQILCNELKDLTMFATCALISIDKKNHTFSCINAGHCPIIFKTHDHILKEIEPSGPPLGLFIDTTYTLENYPIQGGETFLLVTDGIYEWPIHESPWGWPNWMDFLIKNHYLENPETLWEDLQLLIKTESDDEEPTDDQTLLYWHLNTFNS